MAEELNNTAMQQNPVPNKNMTVCKACGAQIAKGAKACPACGAKNKKPIFKRVWFWAIIVVVLLGIVIGTSGGDSEPQKTGENGNSVSATTQKTGENGNSVSATTQKTEYQIGDIVELNGASVVVNRVEKSSGDSWNAPKNGHEYVIVEVTIKNIGSSTISYNPFDFKMQNSQGNITEQTWFSSDRNNDLSSGELAPGGSVTGTIPFEEPIGDEGLVLIYEGNIWDSKQIRFVLN